MRILLMHNHHAGPGGAMEVLADEGALLAQSGHQVREYTLPAADQLGLSGLQAGMKAVWNREAGREAGRIIDEFRPDVVHVHTPFPLLSPVVFRVAAARRVPTVATLHSYRYSCVAGTCYRDGKVCEDCVGTKLKTAGVRHRCYHESYAASGALTLSLLLHRAVGTFDHAVNRYLALTSFAQRLMVRDGFPPERVIVKANFVHDSGGAVAADRDRPYVVFAGRLIDVKGIRTLLDGWQRSHPAGLTLRIAGDGPLRGLVEERMAADPSIEYLGWISQEEVMRQMGAATCVVLTSEWYEGGQPLVTIRSMSVGTPILVSDLANLCEDILEDGAGIAFRTGDPSALAAALDTLASDPDTWTDRGRAARDAYLKRHTPQATVAALERIYSDVIAEGADSPPLARRVRP